MVALPKVKLSPAVLGLVAACVVFLLAPYVPQSMLNLLVGNRVAAFAVIAVNLYVLRQDYVLGLAYFIAACSLFLENRRRKVSAIVEKTHVGAPIDVLNQPAPDLVPGEIHPSREEPSVEDMGYEPSEHENSVHGGRDFGSSSATEDDKSPLGTVPSNASDEVVSFLESRGLA